MPDVLDSLTNPRHISSYAPTVANPATEVAGDGFWGDDAFTFDDVIDLINALQHPPVLSSIYRSVTGDEISNGVQIAGGGLFGGPIGVFSAAVNVMFEEATDGDVIDQVANLFDGDGDDGGDGAPAVFAMAAGSPETHDQATGTVAPTPATEAAPVVALAAATGEKAPESLESPEAGVWLSSTPRSSPRPRG